jgi:hypothetical protein
MYLGAVDSDMRGNAGGVPYLTMVLWADSDDAALRVTDAQGASVVKHASNMEPPPELLPPGAAPTYSSLIDALRNSGEEFLETGEYRIATDGAFLHKVVWSSYGNYYFRSPEELADECPYVICRNLEDEPTTR